MDPAIQKKLSAAFDKLASTDIKEPRYNRTVDKSLRRMGFKKRPPQYQSYWSNAIFEGVFFTVALTLLVFLIYWIMGRLPMFNIRVGVFAGVFYGPVAGYIYQRERQVYKLREWERLGENDSDLHHTI